MVSENAQACPHCGNPMQVGYGYGLQPQNYNAYNNPNNYNPAPVVSPKSKTTTGILAIFLGFLGIHYFYLGKPIPGIILLVCSLTFVLSWFAFGFTVVQGIIILCMSDEQFNAKYVNTTNQFPLF